MSSNVPSNLAYTKDHEWVLLEGPVARVGITDFAAHQLGDIVFVELPEPGRKVSAGESVAVIESVKSVADVYAPLAGVIEKRHDGLDPVRINADPYGEGWLFEIRFESAGGLLSPQEYQSLIASA